MGWIEIVHGPVQALGPYFSNVFHRTLSLRMVLKDSHPFIGFMLFYCFTANGSNAIRNVTTKATKKTAS